VQYEHTPLDRTMAQIGAALPRSLRALCKGTAKEARRARGDSPGAARAAGTAQRE